MMRTLTVVVMMLLVGTTWARERRTSLEWEIGSLVQDFLKQQDCYFNESSFAGCVVAIESLILSIRQESAPADDPLFVPMKKLMAEIPRPKLSELRPSLRPRKLSEFREARKAAIAEIFRSSENALRFDEMALKIARLIPEEDQSEAARIALNQLFEIQDPHKALIADEGMTASISLDGSAPKEETAAPLGGIGAELGPHPNGVEVKRTIMNSPAYFAGLRPKDLIFEVDRALLRGKTVDEVVQMIQGPVDTPVRLSVLRAGRELVYEIPRKRIHADNLSDAVFARPSRNSKEDKELYGYLRLQEFEGPACSSMMWTIQGAPQELKGWILDFRGNPGGMRDAAVCIAGFFLGREKLVTKTLSLDGKTVEEYYSQSAFLTDLPLAVLVDGDSASASELLVGALQDHQRAWIIGDRTFGKGTMQKWQPLPWHMSLAETTGRYFLPSGRTPQIYGIIPDFEVEPFPGATEDDRFSWREETLYENPLPPMGERWVQPRGEAVKKIQDCLTKEGIAKTAFRSQRDDRRFVDYPIMAAEDILHCAAKKSGGWLSFWPFQAMR